MFNKFMADEAGFVVSSELVLIATMLVLGLLVGMNTLRNSITSELDDVADAIGNINQDYSYAGITGHSASVAGTIFDDISAQLDHGRCNNRIADLEREVENWKAVVAERDRTLRAHQLRIDRLRFPSLQPGVVALLNTYAPALAEQSLREVVLHRLQPQDLRMADALGMQPGPITVTDTGLVIGFVLKPL